MYASCHFRRVIRPVVLWVPGTSFLYTCWWAQAEQGSLTLSRSSSSTNVSATLYHTAMCPPRASTRAQGRDLASRKRQLCLEMTLCLSPGVQQETHPSDKESRSLILSGPPSLARSYGLLISFPLVEREVPC